MQSKLETRNTSRRKTTAKYAVKNVVDLFWVKSILGSCLLKSSDKIEATTRHASTHQHATSTRQFI